MEEIGKGRQVREMKEDHRRRKVRSDIKEDKKGQGLNQPRSQFANL